MRVLETERLTLRWFDEGDAPFVLELLNSPGWIANIGDRGVRTVEGARGYIAEKLVASYWRHGLGLWAVERRSDGALVGMCGLVRRETLPAVDVGYALPPRFCGQGYAREAAIASVRYAREVLGQGRVLAQILPSNGPSIRVAEAIGMVPAGTHRDGEEDVALFTTLGERDPWDGGPAREPRGEIDAIARRLFAWFSNRRGLSLIAAVPSLFLPDAIVSIVKPPAVARLETMGVRAFVEPRAALLQGGRVTDFEEEEVEACTEVEGALAHRTSRYRKSGLLDGAPFEGGGRKHFQLVLTARGWRIAALAWEDDAAPPPAS